MLRFSGTQVSENKLARTETTTVTPLEPSAVWEDNDPSKSQIVAYPSSVHPLSAYENFALGLEGFFASFVFHRAADLNSSDAPFKWFAIFQTNYHLGSGDR